MHSVEIRFTLIWLTWFPVERIHPVNRGTGVCRIAQSEMYAHTSVTARQKCRYFFFKYRIQSYSRNIGNPSHKQTSETVYVDLLVG